MNISEKKFKIDSTIQRKIIHLLARHLSDADADAILDLEVEGLYRETQYKRYYPAGEVTAQLIGITDYQDAGQEGLELAFNDWLKGERGTKKVVQDVKSRVINNLSLVKPSKPGNDLELSIDLRIQYAAYTELKKAVKQHKAQGGSIVILDVLTGEILAMANQPSFNPNNRESLNQMA
ncbi:MAG: hypothetical protein CM15mP51_16740 [Porticoccaceae bacterium]|nr:MAG: hypothetical protein CM15mP51_16740 [Porticoccaceae bacterium]